MTEDFALIDFALSARSPAEIAEALGRVRASQARPREDQPPTPEANGGFLSRLLRRGGPKRKKASPVAPLLIQPTGTLGPPPLTRLLLADMGYGASDSPVRLTAPLGVAGLTLIEFRDGDTGVSSLCEGLSEQLRGDEVFYFRHSGSRHPGAHFAFHVYQDGRLTRRAESSCAEGTAPEAPWDGIDSGMPHPLEADSLPAPGTPNSEIMTPVRQAIILESLGIDPDTIFDGGGESSAALVILELSSAAGGLPLSDARAEVERARQKTAQAPVPINAPETPHGVPINDTLAQPEAPSTWEEEVTALLVSAVESALPPDEQVAWLDGLTGMLVSGDIDAALQEAGAMILAGNRSAAEKEAALHRLGHLFGQEDEGGGSH